ncbi:protein of unknown function (plasmid) [Caballeronia sp. S22]
MLPTWATRAWDWRAAPGPSRTHKAYSDKINVGAAVGAGDHVRGTSLRK